MNNDTLIQAMPDVVAFVRQDGFITHHIGGRGIPFLAAGNKNGLAGSRLADLFPAAEYKEIARLIRRALKSRKGCESEFLVNGATYQIRLAPQGPERVMCVLRQVAEKIVDERAEEPGLGRGPLDRRFFDRFERAITDAKIQEQPLALGIMYLDGLDDIGKLVDYKIAQQIMDGLRLRLPERLDPAGATWFTGQLGDSMLGLVITGDADRGRIREAAELICASVARPLQVQDAEFHIIPAMGVAILGEDACRADALLDHARSAMFEARRAGVAHASFYSDTVKLRPVARLDIARELRRAIENGQFLMHYASRHELSSGRLSGIQAYLRWAHPLRGRIPPSEFLAIANATGLAAELSRCALQCVLDDLPPLRRRFGPHIPISFGPLRQHIRSDEWVRDIQRLDSGKMGCFEVRISERSLASLRRPEHSLGELAEWGARLVIDEVGRSAISLPMLARIPLSGLQIERGLAIAAAAGDSSQRACRAVAAVATVLGVNAIAPGVDDAASRDRLAAAGFSQGLGDLYPVMTALDAQPRVDRETVAEWPRQISGEQT